MTETTVTAGNRAVTEAVEGLWIEWIDEIDSTNQELMRRAELLPHAAESLHPKPEAIWLVAQRQTAGRGRRGKQWQSVPGKSMVASFARELPAQAMQHLTTVPLVAGIVIAEYLGSFGVRLGVKWPNDLCLPLSEGPYPYAKVGGILCEMRSRGAGGRLVIGCGLNLQADAADSISEQPVAGLFAASQPVDVRALTVGIGLALQAGIRQLLDEGFGAFADRWHALDVLSGLSICVHDASGTRDAVVVGIDQQGHLLVRGRDGAGPIEALSAESISVRPRSSAHSKG